MKKLIFSFILFFSSQSFALDLSKPDKQLHMNISFFGSLVFYSASREIGLDKTTSIITAFMLMNTLGYIKEINDQKFDVEDMQANAIGSSLGLAIPLIFTEF